MAVSDRRPVIGPGLGASFAYLTGQFYWSLDNDLSELRHYFNQQRISLEQQNAGVWGHVWNTSREQKPRYLIQIVNPGDESNAQPAFDKLKGLFPGLQITSRILERLIPWHRGVSGKGLLAPDGDLLLWQVDDYGNPHHDDVAARSEFDYIAKFDITPSGKAFLPWPMELALIDATPEQAGQLIDENGGQYGLTFTPRIGAIFDDPELNPQWEGEEPSIPFRKLPRGYEPPPKFEVGDYVVERGYGNVDVVLKGEWNPEKEEWEYYVDREASGHRYWMNEKDLSRTMEDSAPTTFTLRDLGIPPEGEEYFRSANWRLSDIMDDNSMSSAALLNNQIAFSDAARTAVDALTQAGGQVYVVGGAVRDAIMDKVPKDIDLMVGGLDEDTIARVLQPLGRVDFTGKAFGVFRFRKGNDEVEIAMPRVERSIGSGHNDFEVNVDPNLPPEDDLGRRDFTINAMAYHPQTNSFIDPHGGMNDIQNRRLALVSDSAFADDPLRIVRALVSTARYGFEPDPQLIDSMAQNASSIRNLPGERVQQEMDKLLSAPDPTQAMALAEQTGLLDYLAPELSASVGFDQRNPHHELNVWDHTLAVLRKTSQLSNDPDLRLAALFHDSGKPDSFWHDPDAPEGGGGHFYEKQLNDGSVVGKDHQDVGANLAQAYMERLRYPTKRIDRVTTLVQNHMFPYFNSTRGARKFLNSLGGDVKLADDLLILREADASGKSDGTMNDFDAQAVEKSRGLLREVLDEGSAFSKKDLAINGHDLIQELGMEPGPEIGKTLDYLMNQVIEHPELNNKETLLEMARNGERLAD